MFKAKISVTLKPDVMDPQGQTIQSSLHTLGYKDIAAVKAGKYFIIDITGNSREKVEEQIHEICHRFLSNPIIETFNYEIEEVE